jgi:hypothetical protein
MTEAQWRTSISPEAILNFLTDKASKRKLRLYAIGCCRRIWHLLTDDRCQYAVEVAQRYVDGRATDAELSAAGQIVASVARVWGDVGSPVPRSGQALHALGGAAWATTRSSAWVAAWDAAWDARMAARDHISGTDWEKERVWQAGLLRDLIGNPFHPPHIEPAWLFQEDGAVHNLAQVIYDEGRFGDLPILADALEEAGCTHTEMLEHCHTPGLPHYRGCWVVDAVLGFV